MGDAIQKTAISSLQEVRNLIKELPGPDLESLKIYLTRCSNKADGSIKSLPEWLASWQAQYLKANHPRTSVFAGITVLQSMGFQLFRVP